MYRRLQRGLGSSSAVPSIQALITQTANQYGVPPAIALGVAQKESGFNQAAVGTSGEIGVMQLMPATAAGLNVDPKVLSQNIDGGVSLLASLYKQFGDWTQALEAYNAGPGAVTSGNVPSSSQSYAASILGSVAAPASGFPGVDSLALDLGIPDDSGGDLTPLYVSGTSPWVWAAVALAGVGLLWYATA